MLPPPTGPAEVPAPLARLGRVVWPDGDGGHRLRIEPPSEDGRVERYLVLPHLGDPRFLLPLDASPAARTRLLLRYNRLRAYPRRVTRSALAPAVRLGVPVPRAGTNVVYAAPGGRVRPLLEELAEALGAPAGRLVLSTGVRAGHGALRPTLNVTDPDGRPQAFVKVAATAEHRASLTHEHELAAGFDRQPAPGVLVPRPLLRLEWAGSLVVGVEALPPDVRRVHHRERERVLPWLDRLVASRPREALRLADSPWLAALRSKAALLPEPWATPAATGVARCEERYGDRIVEHGLRHGDWSPWNMAWTRDGLAVWDWEFAQPLAPLGLDEWNWPFAHATSARGVSMARAAADLRAEAAGRARSELAAELVLVDMAVRRAAEAAAGSRSAAAYARDLLAVLER